MPSLFIIINYFLFIAFISHQTSWNYTSPLLSYYGVQFMFIQNNLLFYAAGALIATLLYVNFNKARKHRFKMYKRIVQKTAALLAVGSLVSYVVLFLIAIVQMNVLSLITTINPKMLGIKTELAEISESLKHLNSSPNMIGSDAVVLVRTVAVSQAGEESFYGGRIISFVPNFLILPSKSIASNTVMVDDSLIIKNINSSDMQVLSPFISFLMIKDYFPDKEIRSYPEVSLLDKKDYIGYREVDFAEKLVTYDEILNEIKKNTNSLLIAIEQEKIQISENQARYEETRTQKERQYSICMNTGYYQSGVFYRTNTQDYCREQVESLEELLISIRKENNEATFLLEQNQKKITQYEDYVVFYNNQKLLTLEESEFISFEFAVFNPPDKIKITQITNNNRQALADYYALLMHEYLHYQTFNENGKKINSTFFTEGLTEYFARNVVKKSLGLDTNLGYPVNVKIIEQMTKRIGEKDLSDVFFSNDQERLEKLLDRAYGEGFYKNNYVLFETIQYTTKSDQILELSGEIMEQIGGNPLSKDDVTTNYDSFR